MKVLLTICLLLTPSIAMSQTRAEIKEAERRLAGLGYWTGAVDGILDRATRFGLIAFQKYEGRAATGQLTLSELEAIRAGSSPKAKESGYEHVEVDLDRQVMMLVNADGEVRVLHISSGFEGEFLEESKPSIAHTPRGRFIVYDKVAGWDGKPGGMYYSSYISGGVAIHGYPSVPTEPASHGCIRLPIFVAKEVSKLMPLGTIVLVYDKVTFVSAKEWIADPALKEAALAVTVASGFDDYSYQPSRANKSRTVVIKKARPRITRAD